MNGRKYRILSHADVESLLFLLVRHVVRLSFLADICSSAADSAHRDWLASSGEAIISAIAA